MRRPERPRKQGSSRPTTARTVTRHGGRGRHEQPRRGRLDEPGLEPRYCMRQCGVSGVMSQTHVAGGALFTAAGLGAATAAGWMRAPAWALVIGIAWGAIAGELPDIDHPKARVSRGGVAFGLAGRLLALPARVVGRVRPRPAGNAPRPDALARVHGAVGDDRRPPVCRVRRRPGRACLDARADRRGFPHGRAPEPAAGDAVPARAPGGDLPIRRGVHRAWIPLAPGARLAHRSRPVGVAVRSPALLARSRLAPDPPPAPRSRPGWSGRR
jgi:hypothetical protein